MINIVEVLSPIYRRHVHMAINYMIQCPSEIRDESFITDFCKEGQHIIIANEIPVGYFSSYKKELNGKKYLLIHLFEIFYPFRGKNYAKQTIQLLSEKQNVIITHPLSINHWINVLGIQYFRNQIQKIGLHDFYKLVKMDPFGEGYGEQDRLAFYRRLTFDNSNHTEWPEFQLAIKADTLAPLIELEYYSPTLQPICYIISDNVLLGKMILGTYHEPSTTEINALTAKYKLTYQASSDKFAISHFAIYPSKTTKISLDSYITLMKLGSSKIYNTYEERYYDLTIDGHLRVYEDNEVRGILMGNEILELEASNLQ